MNTSPELSELATALAKAQSQMEGAKKASENSFFTSKYADLSAVWDAVRKPLTDNGLSVVQTAETTDKPDEVAIHTTLFHSSGQWITARTVLLPKDASPQALGSVISYGRRYALAAMVGAVQVDDDGNAGSGRDKPPQSDPHGTERAKETKAVNEYAGRVIALMNKGSVSGAVDLLTEAKDSSEEFASSVWRVLPTDIRNSIKDAQAARKF